MVSEGSPLIDFWETMKIEAYIRVLSTEQIVHAINRDAKLSTARMIETKAQKGSEKLWNWQTPNTPIDTNNVDGGVGALLIQHKKIFPVIRNYSGPETDVYLEVVTYYKQGEEPQGLYLSAETIQLLYELGAALDNDVVYDLSQD